MVDMFPAHHFLNQRMLLRGLSGAIGSPSTGFDCPRKGMIGVGRQPCFDLPTHLQPTSR